MMIFCVLTTAASIIQKYFRAFIAKKNQKKAVTRVEEYMSESGKLEDRILVANK